MKNQIIKAISLGAIALLPILAFAGQEGTNSSYCSQNGNICSTSKFKMTNRHYYHDEIIAKLEADKRIPELLKRQLIYDLSSTLVIYSDEDLEMDELRERYELQIVSRDKTKHYDASGNLTGSTETTKEKLVKILPNLGIYIQEEQVNYKASPGKLKVQALTELYPVKRVIYFEKYAAPKNNSIEEKMRVYKIIFHEQAHRLDILESIRNDERSVEAWSDLMVNYLFGKRTAKELIDSLKIINPKVVIAGFLPKDGVLDRIEKETVFYYDLPVRLTKRNIKHISITNMSLKLLVDKSVFNSIDLLSGKDQLIDITEMLDPRHIYLGGERANTWYKSFSDANGYADGYNIRMLQLSTRLLESFTDYMREKNDTIELKLRIYYKETYNSNSNNFSQEVTSITWFDSDSFISDTVVESFKKIDIGNFPFKLNVILSPDIKLAIMFQRLELNTLIALREKLHNFLNPALGPLSDLVYQYSLDEKKAEMDFEINEKMLTSFTTEEILELITKHFFDKTLNNYGIAATHLIHAFSKKYNIPISESYKTSPTYTSELMLGSLINLANFYEENNSLLQCLSVSRIPVWFRYNEKDKYRPNRNISISYRTEDVMVTIHEPSEDALSTLVKVLKNAFKLTKDNGKNKYTIAIEEKHTYSEEFGRKTPLKDIVKANKHCFQ